MSALRYLGGMWDSLQDGAFQRAQAGALQGGLMRARRWGGRKNCFKGFGGLLGSSRAPQIPYKELNQQALGLEQFSASSTNSMISLGDIKANFPLKY